jgi:hypothetical protein
MIKITSVDWNCDFCHIKATSANLETIPYGWNKVEVKGSSYTNIGEYHLCCDCSSIGIELLGKSKEERET